MARLPDHIAALQEKQWQKIERHYFLPVDKLTLAVELVRDPHEIIVYPIKLYSNKNRTSMCLAHYADKFGNSTIGYPQDHKLDAGMRIALFYHRKRHNAALVRIERRPPNKHCEYCWVCKRMHRLGVPRFTAAGER